MSHCGAKVWHVVTRDNFVLPATH